MHAKFIDSLNMSLNTSNYENKTFWTMFLFGFIPRLQKRCE